MLNLRKENSGRRIVVLSIDGLPYSFLEDQGKKDRFPNFKRLLAKGTMRRMNSVQPCISSVAWSSYLTGKNPGKHNIFGFVDRKPGTCELFVPTALNMSGDTILDVMGRGGKRVFMMNVPTTYPPRYVNGILIGCFLCTQPDKIAYPASVSQELKQLGYIIDADARVAREDLDRYLDHCNAALSRRAEALFYYLRREQWDFFQCHIMETDRMNHFFWKHMETDDPKYSKAFFDFYERVDELVGEVDRCSADAELIILSDHGFCGIKKEMYLNYYLAEAGLLKIKTSSPKSLADMHPESLAYSLIPGRIFINLKNREPHGMVDPNDYENVRDQVAEALLSFKDPETGKTFVREVLRREEIYSGPHVSAAADLIAVPHDGYDLKADIRKMIHWENTALVGMHTFEDSMLFVRDRDIAPAHNEFWIGDVAPTILKMMSLPIPPDMDGVPLLAN